MCHRRNGNCFPVPVFGVVFLFLFVFVMCLVYPMLSVSLDCSFLIALSFFSSVYFVPNTQINQNITRHMTKTNKNKNTTPKTGTGKQFPFLLWHIPWLKIFEIRFWLQHKGNLINQLYSSPEVKLFLPQWI
jgi:hypothetical protein